MKRIMFLVVVLMMVATGANAQSKKKVTYKQTDIEGMWYATEVFNENKKKWEILESGENFAVAFSDVKTVDGCFALFAMGNDVTKYIYTLSNNTIRMYSIADSSELLITIKILSAKKGESLIGMMGTISSDYNAKFKFIHYE